MADYFKTDRNRSTNKTYIIPTSHLLRRPLEGRSSAFEELFKCYNFSLSNFLRYVKLKYDADIELLQKYPYFSIIFKQHGDGELFCQEANAHYKIYISNEQNQG